jgi:prefoldin subunit 5
MNTKQELLQKPTEELVKIILDFQRIVTDLTEEVRQLKDELAKAKKSRPGQK